MACSSRPTSPFSPRWSCDLRRSPGGSSGSDGGAGAVLGFITWVRVGVAQLAVLGVGNECVAVTLMTMVQRVTPAAMLRRVMSLVMVTMLGVQPVSTIVSGALIRLGAGVLFGVFNAGVLFVAVVASAFRRSWSLEALEAGAPAAAQSAA